MSTLSRKYDFVAGQRARSAQVDEELNQLVTGHNDHDGRIVTIETDYATTAEVDVKIAQAQFGEQVFTMGIPYVVVTGSANAYIATLSPPATSYTDGMALAVKINVNNTGASTINVNALGSKSILDSRGNPMTSGKLKVNIVYTLRYNGTAFILQGEGGGGNALVSELLFGKTATADSGDIVGTMPNRSVDQTAVDQIYAGTVIGLKPPAGYYNGNVRVNWSDPDFIAANIKNGVNLFGLAGSLVEGRKEASGTVTSANVGGQYKITVTGLSFVPKIIIVGCDDPFYPGQLNEPYGLFLESGIAGTTLRSYLTAFQSTVSTAAWDAITSSGFTFNTTWAVVRNYKWIAFS